jgi:hypothetical protein
MEILRLLSLICIAIFIDSLIILILGLTHPWPQAGIMGYSFLTPFNMVFSLLVFISCLYCKGIECCNKEYPPTKRKCIMTIFFLLSLFYFPAQLINLSSIISSQIGNSKIRILVRFEGLSNVPSQYDESFPYYYEDEKYFARDDYYIIFGIKQAGFGKIILGIILGSTAAILSFFVIVLIFSYIHRALFEYNTPNRNYTAKLYSIEENGEKIDVDNIEVSLLTVKLTKNVKGKEIVEEQQIYSRKAIARNVEVNSNEQFNNFN